jgi:phage repressor protein C with HTH and peptisase S24 domain
MSTLAERIQEVIEAGFNQVEIANAAGVTKGASNQWLSGGIKSIKLQYAQGIEALTGFSAEWLVTGKGEKKRSKDVSEFPALQGIGRPVIPIHDEEDIPGLVRIKKVRLRLSAGIAGYATDLIEEDESPISFRSAWLAKRGFIPEKLVAIEIRGQSMEPGLYDGDTVVINTADTLLIDGEVYAVNYEGEAVVKRLVREMGSWWLVSDNPDQRRFPRKQCAGGMCIIIGRVIHKQSEKI